MASAFVWTWWIQISKNETQQLRVGRLLKAHGLKGAIKLELFTDDPARRFVPGAVFTLQVPSGHDWHGKTLELIELKWFNSHAVAFFKGVPDRTAAEALVKAILWIDQASDEQSAEEDAWFDHQLVGLDVVRDGEKIGVVRQVNHMPAQDLLVIELPSGEVLVPFVKAIVPAVDIAAGTMTITPPPGLLEELPESDDDEAPASETDSAIVDESADDADSAEEASTDK